mmetsp:Transcript_20134/g.51890  ORF Transcript_20134/g.51890 Transcript_20134/m.51890 type:complete len:203 (+) Transcript_20134:53-661(+)|eukprot:CAMPEP_0119409488 /NCGR_PEP_ID=MMETSP1335-20130426/2761_1 /TAXON_ID=259385 /ORGANISM="Chrysoculter rhomboideus, Strain RCC1486" /LENGTH=202 /DNA_ID=CAMNT_0007433877 /DNA_START=60 /DNA_END=668 /DNA_ORIENTATION=+
MDQQAIMQQVAAVALQTVEKAVDNELERMENMNEDDYARLRRQRLEHMKEQALEKEQWRRNDHGTLQVITDQKEFFDACKKSKRCIILFYRTGNKWCDVLTDHFRALASRHMEAKFMKVDAENSPFLVERLNVWMMPTIICTKEGKVHRQFNGLSEIDPSGKFETASLEFALHNSEMLDDTPMVDQIMSRMNASDDDDDEEY